RYFVYDEHFKEGSPVFLEVGFESPISEYSIRSTQMASYYSPRFHALTLGLEARFYGESHPLNDTSVDSLKLLTIEQMLADIASFIDFYKMTDKRTLNSKWIVFGCSFSGALAAWMRTAYPDHVNAAVAYSGPINVKFNFKEYLEVTSQVLGKECSSNVDKAFNELSSYLKNQTDLKNFYQQYGICENFDGKNAKDVSLLMLRLIEYFQATVQYNNQDYNIEEVCEIMSKEQPLAKLNQRFLNYPCLDVSYTKALKVFQKTELDAPAWDDLFGNRQYIYQLCNEIASFQTTDSKNQPFGSDLPIGFFTTMCADIFGNQFNSDFIEQSVSRTNLKYARDESKLTNLVIINGAQDPWRIITEVNSTSSTVKSFVIDNGHHCPEYD
ncbi:putative serine protease K12H4.7-like protein, partial [Dinothrombium tinctorium]